MLTKYWLKLMMIAIAITAARAGTWADDTYHPTVTDIGLAPDHLVIGGKTIPISAVYVTGRRNSPPPLVWVEGKAPAEGTTGLSVDGLWDPGHLIDDPPAPLVGHPDLKYVEHLNAVDTNTYARQGFPAFPQPCRIVIMQGTSKPIVIAIKDGLGTHHLVRITCWYMTRMF